MLYGTIGAIVALLLFLRLGSDLFLIAAELSATLRDRRRAAGSNPGGPRPAESDSTAGAGGTILVAWPAGSDFRGVMRDRDLRAVALAYLGFNMTEFATWIAILVFAFDHGGAAEAGAWRR